MGLRQGSTLLAFDLAKQERPLDDLEHFMLDHPGLIADRYDDVTFSKLAHNRTLSVPEAGSDGTIAQILLKSQLP